MKTYKTILIDDEISALKNLEQKILKSKTPLDIVATFQKPEEAITYLNNNEIDLMFVDVQMPRLDGFQMLAQLESINFQIIFVTAFSDYAIDAIKTSAVDYVLKPIENSELKSAIDKAITIIEKEDTIQDRQHLIAMIQDTINPSQKIVVSTTKGMHFIPQEDIIHVEGYDGYTKIHLVNETCITSSYSLGKFAPLLNDTFFKCHKSHIVNLSKVTEFENEGYLILNSKNRVPISRTYRNVFLETFNQA